MRNLDELGLKPRLRNQLPPPTTQAILEFERHYSFKLPPDYVVFLTYMNGGRAAAREYSDPVAGAGEVNDFYGLGTMESDTEAAASDRWDIGNLWGETRVQRDSLGPLALPFARDGGNNQLYLDLSVTPPSVRRYVSETGSSYLIAKSFADFVDSLKPPTPTNYTGFVRSARVGSSVAIDLEQGMNQNAQAQNTNRESKDRTPG